MEASNSARITYGLIVLNGEPFTRYNIRAIYPFAHQIIVVEGACPTACKFATKEGHSSDGTLEILKQFQREEDVEEKLIIVTSEDEGHPDGFWTEKDDMSQAWARRATGNYLWQVDIDEFYHTVDIQAVIHLLEQDRTIKALTFRTLAFWGGLGYRTDGVFLRKGAQDFHRVFAWGDGYRYTTHRPPTVVDERGRDVRQYNAISADFLSNRGIYMYHYSFVFPFQVRFKFGYYDGLDQVNRLSQVLRERRANWTRNYFDIRNPFLIDDTSVLGQPSWLVRFEGEHPEAIRQLWADIEKGVVKVERRATEDIERLLSNSLYTVATKAIPVIQKPIDWCMAAARSAYHVTRRVLGIRKEERTV